MWVFFPKVRHFRFVKKNTKSFNFIFWTHQSSYWLHCFYCHGLGLLRNRAVRIQDGRKMEVHALNDSHSLSIRHALNKFGPNSALRVKAWAFRAIEYIILIFLPGDSSLWGPARHSGLMTCLWALASKSSLPFFTWTLYIYAQFQFFFQLNDMRTGFEYMYLRQWGFWW